MRGQHMQRAAVTDTFVIPRLSVSPLDQWEYRIDISIGLGMKQQHHTFAAVFTFAMLSD